MRSIPLLLAALVAVGFAPAEAVAQHAPSSLTLRIPDAEHAEPFTAIVGVRELRDGRVVVADRTEKTIQLIDLASGNAVRIGREGGGPNEYRQPMMLFPLPGDSTLVFDSGNMRYLTIAPDGRLAGTFTVTIDDASGAPMRLNFPAAADGQGNLYFVDRGLQLTPGTPAEAPDSATILRHDRRAGTTTAVGRIGVPKATVQSSGNAGNARVMVRMSAPFAAQDSWAVGWDGRLALVRGQPYRAEWVAPNGKRVVGPEVAYEPVKVTEAEKEAWREARKRPGAGMSVTIGGPGGGTSIRAGGPPPGAAPPQEPTSWPATKPPFVANTGLTSGAHVVVAADGRLWVQRYRPASEPEPLYDIFDSYGRVVSTAVLPRNTRLVGFGRESVYLVRTDEDDLQYLQRYRVN